MKFKCTLFVLDESPIKNSLPVKRTSPPSISPGGFISTTLRPSDRTASFKAIVSPLLEACPKEMYNRKYVDIIFILFLRGRNIEKAALLCTS